MLKNFFKIAIRNLSRHKGFSFINISGLTLGLCTCLLIGLFVWDEHQYDKFLPEGDQVYRIYNGYSTSTGTEERAIAPPTFAPTLKEFPEIVQTARVLMLPPSKQLFEVDNKKLYEESGYYVDSTFFHVFPLAFEQGQISHALDDPGLIVISEQLSQRFFHGENAIGKTIIVNKSPFLVKGVFRKDPKFHLQFDFLLPLSAAGIPPERMKDWGWQQFYSYFKLKKGTNVASLEAKFQKAVKEKGAAYFKEEEDNNYPLFQPLKDIHLYSSSFKFDAAQRGNITYVNALTLIALFILLIACFNFVNLATAKSLQRAKEVGVRKSIGAHRRHLIFQFIGETLFLTLISVSISVLLTLLILPWLNDFTGKTIPAAMLYNPRVILLLAALTVLVGIMAGFYPALVLSDFQPVKVLKGNTAGSHEPGRTPWLRHGIVVVQFTLSVLLIISALVVYEQVYYLHNKDLGFDKDQIMFFEMRGEKMFSENEAFKNELLKSSGISSVSIGYGFPGDAVAGETVVVPKDGERMTVGVSLLMADYDYIETLSLEIIAGRDFSKKMKTDHSEAFIINETAVREFGFETPEKAVGRPLDWPVEDSVKRGKVIGVVKDFNYKSLYDKIEPAVIQIFPQDAWKVAIKIKAGTIEATLDHVKEVWNKFTPEYPIEYKFLDENFEAMYQSEDKLKTLLWIFTGIAIFIGCLGLFGLAAYAAERRRKEVGIRKVLGATVPGVVLLLSKDFIKLVILSLFIASPIAYYLMNQWLQNFEFRIGLDGKIFILAAVGSTSIAFFTIGFQAVKAALSNPVKSLRSE